MGPRHNAAENGAMNILGAPMDVGFNGAAAQRRGKPTGDWSRLDDSERLQWGRGTTPRKTSGGGRLRAFPAALQWGRGTTPRKT